MIYTVGHSNQPLERFAAILRQHAITALADVRSSPYSRFNPQFNRESLKNSLAQVGIKYVFLGEELGARTKDRSCYAAGKVSYARLAATELFQHGLDRLQSGMREHRIAMMCAEKEPLECHRTILVARQLVNRSVSVRHILGDGSVEPHDELVARLRRSLDLPEHDMFRSDDELTNEAYERQGQRIAYVEP